VEVGEVIGRIRLAGIFGKDIYAPVAALFEDHGFQLGDLRHPRPRDRFFMFAYDWRQDNVESSRSLAEGLEGVRRAKGLERLRVALICQSAGAQICRFLAKYGGASLEEAEAGAARPPPTLQVEKVILVGASNGGALRILRELNRGRKYVRGIGRKMQPEVLSSYVALYEDLPVYDNKIFLDQDGRQMDVDLFAAESWQEFGWGLFGAGAKSRLRRHPRPEIFGDEEERLAFLRRVLDRSLRLQRVLHRDAVGFDSPDYFLVQNVDDDTPRRAVLEKTENGWRTLFAGDSEIEQRQDLSSLTSSPGDGHATRDSQLWLSPQELAALAREPLDVEGSHFDQIQSPGAQRFLLEVLGESSVEAGPPHDAH
jgi:pimeloyl-ACP methyl ester carboxylesterase